ncbi:hypothetical protein FVER14953_21769 [Fusarium verticillioides]|nr:hypothetical protein FVER14953_21769 [Fusarium verticillioides]
MQYSYKYLCPIVNKWNLLLLDPLSENRQSSTGAQQKAPPPTKLQAHIKKTDPKQSIFRFNVQGLHLFDGSVLVRVVGDTG